MTQNLISCKILADPASLQSLDHFVSANHIMPRICYPLIGTRFSNMKIPRIFAGILTLLITQSVRGFDGELQVSVSVLGPARPAFTSPRGLAFDNGGGKLVFSEALNHSLRVLDTETGAVSWLAGGSVGFKDDIGSAAQLNEPWGICLVRGGRLAVADAGNHAIRLVDLQNGNATTLVGSGAPGTEDGVGRGASFNSPRGVAFHPGLDKIFVADTQNSALRSIVLSTALVETVASTETSAGMGLLAGAGLASILGVAISRDSLFISLPARHIIVKVDVASNNEFSLVAGTDGVNGNVDGDSNQARFSQPAGLALSTDDSVLIVVEEGSGGVRSIDVMAQSVSTVLGTSEAAAFKNPLAAAFSAGDSIVVADTGNNVLQKLDWVLDCDQNEAQEGFKCAPCPANATSPCSSGSFRTTCAATTEACRSCDDIVARPPNSVFVGTEGSAEPTGGGVGRCGWSCREGFFAQGGVCAACTQCGGAVELAGCSPLRDTQCAACEGLPENAEWVLDGEEGDGGEGECVWECRRKHIFVQGRCQRAAVWVVGGLCVVAGLIMISLWIISYIVSKREAAEQEADEEAGRKEGRKGEEAVTAGRGEGSQNDGGGGGGGEDTRALLRGETTKGGGDRVAPARKEDEVEEVAASAERGAAAAAARSAMQNAESETDVLWERVEQRAGSTGARGITQSLAGGSDAGRRGKQAAAAGHASGGDGENGGVGNAEDGAGTEGGGRTEEGGDVDGGGVLPGTPDAVDGDNGKAVTRGRDVPEPQGKPRREPGEPQAEGEKVEGVGFGVAAGALEARLESGGGDGEAVERAKSLEERRAAEEDAAARTEGRVARAASSATADAGSGTVLTTLERRLSSAQLRANMVPLPPLVSSPAAGVLGGKSDDVEGSVGPAATVVASPGPGS